MNTTENLTTMEGRWTRLRRDRMAARAAGNTAEVNTLAAEIGDSEGLGADWGSLFIVATLDLDLTATNGDTLLDEDQVEHVHNAALDLLGVRA